MTRRPLIAFSVHMYNNADGPGYCVGTEAYGLEMTIDSDWSVDTVMLCPPRYVADMTDVTSMGVQIGAAYVPGNQDLEALANAGASWVLVYPEDPIRLVTDSGLSVILFLESVGQLKALLDDLPQDPGKLAVAILTNGLDTPAKFEKNAAAVRKQLSKRGLSDARVLACGSFDIERFQKFFGKMNVDGVLMLDAESSDVLYLIATSVGVTLD